jgi:hypothetical protein
MLKLPDPNRFSDNPGDKWDSCYMCGPVKYVAIVHFDAGRTEPVVPTYDHDTGLWSAGETLTGAGAVGPPAITASGDSGKIEGYRACTVTSGSFATDDAAGVLELTTPTGYDSVDLTIFTDDETLSGSVGGTNMMTVNGKGSVSRCGRMYPDANLIEYQGRKYCKEHFAFRFSHDWIDETKVDTSSENERGK